MPFLDTRHKKKSFTLTTLLLSALLLLLFYIGLTYLDPPIENGIAINFGTTDFGSGKVQPKEKIRQEPRQVKPQPVEETPPTSEPQQAPPNEPVEEMLTSNKEETIEINQQKEARRRVEEATKRKKAEAARLANERKEAEERKRIEQENKKRNLDALIGGIGKSDGTTTGSEGDDSKQGDKGDPAGNPYATSYYGTPGNGGGTGGYGLNGRSLMKKNAFRQDCNEEGRVVVEIKVDRSGRVVNAKPGVQGSTNLAPCLLEPAKKTALSYKWNLDSKAPATQTGFIVVNFKLGQ